MSLATQYRPSTFDAVIEQVSTKKILQQQLATNTFSNTYLLCGPSGDGKAQPLTSKIYTKNGSILFRDVKIGDKVLDGRGEETTVLGVFPQGKRNIYRIVFNNKTSIEVADNHLNNIYYIDKIHNNKRVYLTVNTLELIELMKITNRKYFIESRTLNTWSDKNIYVEPYLLGCLIGDGTLHNNLRFTNKDSDILSEVNNKLNNYDMHLKKIDNSKYDYIITRYDSTNYYHKFIFTYDNKDFTYDELINLLAEKGYPRFMLSTILKICDNSAKNTLLKYPELRNNIAIKQDFSDSFRKTNCLREELNKLNLNVDSYDKFIPDNYLRSSIETRIALLQGLMDTDGYTNSHRGNLCYSSVSERLIDDMFFLIRTLGGTCFKREKKVKYRYKDSIKETTTFILSFKIPANIVPFRCKRKLDVYNSFASTRQEPQLQISKVNFDRVDECKCIFVESDEHTYLTDNLVLTHNTTIARIFANELNKGVGKPIEIDGASNNGVDNVRMIIDDAKTRAIDSEYKVIIIDECHAITNAGWQAFLKCIEEPPKYTIFIFCTTDPQKIPATILNRVMRFNLSKISTEGIKKRLKYICEQEHFINYEEACDYISKICNGGMRDAISYLEKSASYNTDLSITNVIQALGNFSYETFIKLSNNIYDNNQAEVLKTVDDIYNSGKDIRLFIEQFLDFALDLNKYCLLKDITLTKIPSILEKPRFKGDTNCILYTVSVDNAITYFNKLVNALLELKVSLKYDTMPRTTVSVKLLNICRGVM